MILTKEQQAILDGEQGETLAKDAELVQKDGELQIFIIIVCVVSGIAFCGCGTLATFYIIDKKKKI